MKKFIWIFINSIDYLALLLQANIERFVDGDKKAIVFEDLFSLRLHVDAYNWDSNYEYSLIDEENYIIRYVYLFYTGKNIDFSENSFRKSY